MSNSYSCIQEPTPSESGIASLSSIANFYGLSASFKEITQLTNHSSLSADMSQMLILAKRLGFEAVPLEGEYHQLPEVTRPNIVVLNDKSGKERYAPLFEIDDKGVVIGDTTTGTIIELHRDDFVRQWSGDCLYVVPETTTFEDVRAQLHDLRNPWKRFRKRMGITPPYLPKILYSLSLFVIIGLIITAIQGVLSERVYSFCQGITIWSLGFAIASSAWGWVFSDSCSSCSRAKVSIGALPLSQIGVGLYSILLIASIIQSPPLLLSIGLGLGLGVHLYLTGLLIKTKTFCIACIVTALAVLLGMIFLIVESIDHVGTWTLMIPAIGAIIAWTTIRFSRNYFQIQQENNQYRLAHTVVQETIPQSSTTVRMVVFKRTNCSHCLIYETVLRPAVEQNFGELVAIEERPADNRPLDVPFIVVLGYINAALSRPSYESLEMVLKAALNKNFIDVRELGGVQIVKTD